MLAITQLSSFESLDHGHESSHHPEDPNSTTSQSQTPQVPVTNHQKASRFATFSGGAAGYSFQDSGMMASGAFDGQFDEIEAVERSHGWHLPPPNHPHHHPQQGVLYHHPPPHPSQGLAAGAWYNQMAPMPQQQTLGRRSWAGDFSGNSYASISFRPSISGGISPLTRPSEVFQPPHTTHPSSRYTDGPSDYDHNQFMSEPPSSSPSMSPKTLSRPLPSRLSDQSSLAPSRSFPAVRNHERSTWRTKASAGREVPMEVFPGGMRVSRPVGEWGLGVVAAADGRSLRESDAMRDSDWRKREGKRNHERGRTVPVPIGVNELQRMFTERRGGERERRRSREVAWDL